MRQVYLDHNATAPIRPEAAEAVACALVIGGNPSSVHAAGRMARAAVERARAEVAALVGVKPEAVIFTSGGTEANGLAVESAISTGVRQPLVALAEHPSTMQTALASGGMVEGWPMTAAGTADLDWLAARLNDWTTKDGPIFAVISAANNETGVIQPVADAAELIHAAGGTLHVDAVQAAGKVAVDFATLGADTLSLSAHKLGGPQGVGALIAGPRAVLSRRQHGGGQERGLRGGTENVSGIAGFGAAAAVAAAELDQAARQASWRDAAQATIAATQGATVFGADVARLPGVLCFATEGFASDRQVMALDLAGVMVSAGAACSSGKVTPSPVLTAMGFASEAATAIRVSGGWSTVEADWQRFVEVWLAAATRVRLRTLAEA